MANSSSWYNPHWHYEHEPQTRAALDLIFSDYFSRNEPGVFAPLRDALHHFVEHRREVVTRRSVFELREAKSRQEIVEGLGIAVDNIDRVIQIIRAAPDPEVAKAGLVAEPLAGLGEFLRRAGRPEAEIAKRTETGDYFLSERQAQAILEMRLQRLTGLEREKLEGEFRELCATIRLRQPATAFPFPWFE